MNVSKKIVMWTVATIALFSAAVSSGQELADFTIVPSLTALGCNSTTNCIYDASRASRLFVYVEDTAQLWAYPSNGGASIMYDLSTLQTELGTGYVVDFVAISDTELLFIGMQLDTAINELTIFNTGTNQIQPTTVDFGNISLTECDAIPADPVDNLYVFPNSSSVLLCGVSDGFRRLIIVDFATNAIAQIINIPSRRDNAYLLPWHKVLVGQDGKIYVESPVYNAFEYLFPTESRSTWENNLIKVAKLDPLTEQWSLLQLSTESIRTNLSTGEFIGSNSINEIAAVDANGYIYYWNGAFSQAQQPVPLLTIFDANGYFVSQIPPSALLAADVDEYLYQSLSGELVFARTSAPGVADLNPVIYLPTPTPTPVATSTPSPTIAPTPFLSCTTTVGSADASGLISAISTANANGASADTICLTANSTYTLTAVNNSTDGPNGLPSITTDITIIGNGATITRDPAAPAFRIFHVAAGGSLTLDGVTINGGSATSASPGNDGGAIYNRGTVNLTGNTSIINSTANADGGAVYNRGTFNIAASSSISGNTAADDGGGVYTSSGTLNVTGGTITDNTAGDEGGGIRSVDSTVMPTLTPTFSTWVLDISAVMPGVYVPPTATDFPFGTILLFPAAYAQSLSTLTPPGT